jgi:hypothetical protein
VTSMHVRRILSVSVPPAAAVQAESEANVSLAQASSETSRSLAAEIAQGIPVVPPAPRVLRNRNYKSSRKSPQERGYRFDHLA